MIKVICKDIGGIPFRVLTINKIYDAIEDRYGYYHIKNDHGFTNSYYKSRFIVLSEWRDNQINSILDDN
jgi:hypothetical protein